jgi:nitrogen-specific signal transduction histidine kinase/CheY-like chemotaxis protein
VGRDVTELLHGEEERRHLQAQILHSQKLESLGVLAGGIAHDFNNLLVGILGNTSLARMKLGADSPASKHLAAVETTARRAADLVRQMLAYSGKAEFVVERLDLNAAIREMTQLLHISISKRARLELELSPEPVVVEGDATQVRQILMNLITNASEAIGERIGLLSVTTGVMTADRAYLAETCLGADLPEGRYAYFEVADTGCGIAEEDKTRIFDPFFSTKSSGRGLGMAAVSGILRGHAGTLRLQSVPGAGTTIRVLLPLCRRPARAADAAAEEEALDGQASGSVLVVDDEDVIRMVARRTLEQAGFDVLAARDGVEALEIYRRHAESIVGVVLDIAMPRLDGIETLYELRLERPDLKVLLSSGYTEQDVVPAFTSRRFSRYLKKPYKPVDLVRELRRLLEPVSPANGSPTTTTNGTMV